MCADWAATPRHAGSITFARMGQAKALPLAENTLTITLRTDIPLVAGEHLGRTWVVGLHVHARSPVCTCALHVCMLARNTHIHICVLVYVLRDYASQVLHVCKYTEIMHVW
jgi:hypothetical protein